MDRRSFTKAFGLTVSASVLTQAGAQPGREPAESAGQSAAQPQRTAQPSAAPPFAIGMLIFDGMTNSDFAAPADVFARVRSAQVHVLGKSLAPITTDANVRVVPNLALEDAPPLDMLFVPGGPGILPLMEDATSARVSRVKGSACAVGHVGMHRSARAGCRRFASRLSRDYALVGHGSAAFARR